MDSDGIERVALGLLAAKISFFAGFFLFKLYQGGRLGSACLHAGVGLLFHYLREETRH